ncbi:YkgJ family cysteine cluster protein [Desulfosarcina ovata]|uniref:Lipoprotein n=1 Tax=Desulfosarcina ovata subsp. ovata TaxID=2752305 RepID=A0A5K8AGS2_9BACT|nr:YkgJ family cysteine cluster protein [Desulfosarcina ovata]BBO91885.1 lipoprotein [Desulfosarcina ovata subsp. ovata]
MKSIDPETIEKLPGTRLKPTDTFRFRCHKDLSCFNRCCRNLNLFLYPYDVVRLKKALGLDADQFLETHVDVILREGNHFPDVLLRMADNETRTCPFLSSAGCTVYPDRPDTCRTFPVEHGILFRGQGQSERVSFFRPPDFCQGQHENQTWTLRGWADDQDAATYNQMTAQWAEIKSLFQKNPWGSAGMNSSKGKMAFMAAYNIDRFREFVFQSSFLKRYRIKKNLAKKWRINDRELMLFGFEWIRYFVWGIASPNIRI